MCAWWKRSGGGWENWCCRPGLRSPCRFSRRFDRLLLRQLQRDKATRLSLQVGA